MDTTMYVNDGRVFLSFTVESEDDFADGVLPELNLNPKVYEDIMTSISSARCPQSAKSTCNPTLTLVKITWSLVQDVKRKMANTSK